MFAVIKTGGKQYRVKKGDTLTVEKLDKKVGSKILFKEVLLLVDSKKVTIGKPLVKGAHVEAKVLAEGKGKKVTIIKYKPKTRYRRKRGHRQPYTKVQIDNITVAP